MTDRIIPLTFDEYNRITADRNKVEWPVPASTNANEDLAAARRNVEIQGLRNDLRESGALPFNGVTIVKEPIKLSGKFKLVHKCVTPDFLWERMAPSLELRDLDGNIWSYSEFEGYAILRSHEEFPDTDIHNGIYCESCDLLRLIWLRYQLTAALDAFGQMQFEDWELNDIYPLRRAIRYELEIACDPESPASPDSNHPAGKAE